MTQGRTERNRGARRLVWLLLIAIVCMGLTVTRQQALGSLHLHANPKLRGTSTLTAVASSLANDWVSRWRQQQTFGHSPWSIRAPSDAARGLSNGLRVLDPVGVRVAQAQAHAHDHDALERHHHALGTASVVAVDGAAQAVDAAEGTTTGALVLLTVVATPNDRLSVPPVVADNGPWPVDNAAAFVSWNSAPPLRPPDFS